MPSIWKSEDAVLAQAGPSVRVSITQPGPILEATKGENKTPPTVSVRALIDTGASCSCIDQGIAEQLKLTPRDEREMLTPGGLVVQLLYDVRLSIDGIHDLFELEVLGADLARQENHVLLGRDVLRHGTLIYSGRSNSFEFCV